MRAGRKGLLRWRGRWFWSVHGQTAGQGGLSWLAHQRGEDGMEDEMMGGRR